MICRLMYFNLHCVQTCIFYVAYQHYVFKGTYVFVLHCVSLIFAPHRLLDKCLPIQNLLYVSFKQILISLASLMGTPNSENTVKYSAPN
jgi:hypothetical protein